VVAIHSIDCRGIECARVILVAAGSTCYRLHLHSCCFRRSSRLVKGESGPNETKNPVVFPELLQTTAVPSSMQNSLLLPGSVVPGFTWVDFAHVVISIVQEDKADPQVVGRIAQIFRLRLIAFVFALLLFLRNCTAQKNDRRQQNPRPPIVELLLNSPSYGGLLSL